MQLTCTWYYMKYLSWSLPSFTVNWINPEKVLLLILGACLNHKALKSTKHAPIIFVFLIIYDPCVIMSPCFQSQQYIISVANARIYSFIRPHFPYKVKESLFSRETNHKQPHKQWHIFPAGNNTFKSQAARRWQVWFLYAENNIVIPQNSRRDSAMMEFLRASKHISYKWVSFTELQIVF